MALSIENLKIKGDDMAFGLSKGVSEKLGTKSIDCEKHGAYEGTGIKLLFGAGREVWTRCPECEKDRLEAERLEKVERLSAIDKANFEAKLGQTYIPVRFIGRNFENFIADTDGKQLAKDVAIEYAQNFESNLKDGKGLVLSGLMGTGKSHLATAILQSILPKHVGMYTTCMAIVRSIRGTWRKDSDRSENDVLQTLGDMPLLVIDEIGVQYGTDGEQHIIFEVMDRRYRDMMPTILITNQDRDGFKKFVGDRTFDRLRESCKWVAFDWSSYRSIARES